MQDGNAKLRDHERQRRTPQRQRIVRSLCRWLEYEHVADSLLYDKRHLPRTTPAPDVVLAALAAEKEASQQSQPIVLGTERLTM
jgi:hypothetical protein